VSCAFFRAPLQYALQLALLLSLFQRTPDFAVLPVAASAHSMFALSSQMIISVIIKPRVLQVVYYTAGVLEHHRHQTGTLQHFFLGHNDDIRSLACCSAQVDRVTYRALCLCDLRSDIPCARPRRLHPIGGRIALLAA
jgi:hypothetical protein